MSWPNSCCGMTDTQRCLCTHPDLQLAILLLASCCQQVQSDCGLRLQLCCPVLHHHVHDAPSMDVRVKRGAPRRVHCRLLLLVHLALFFEHNLRHLVIASFFESWNFSLHKTGNKMEIEQRRQIYAFTSVPKSCHHYWQSGSCDETYVTVLVLRFPHLELETKPNDDLIPVIYIMTRAWSGSPEEFITVWRPASFRMIKSAGAEKHMQARLSSGIFFLLSQKKKKKKEYLCSLLEGFNSHVSRRREHLLPVTKNQHQEWIQAKGMNV